MRSDFIGLAVSRRRERSLATPDDKPSFGRAACLQSSWRLTRRNSAAIGGGTLFFWNAIIEAIKPQRAES